VTPVPPEAGRDLGRFDDWIPLLPDGEGDATGVWIAGDVLVARRPDGRLAAIASTCPHQDLPFVDFVRHGGRPGVIQCSAHGYEYDVATGRCVNAPSVPPPCLATRLLHRVEDGHWVVG
jgi:nitrite reductase/ring-hydroxylating ferredoxin subunit